VYLEKIIYIIQFMSEFRRMILKVSSITNEVATIPVTNDHQDGSWLDTDIYIGELFLNVADDILQTRTDTGIVEVYGGVVGVDWGSITGTLSNQTDLQDALNLKLASGDNVSSLLNDAGYITSNAVDSVNGLTGVVVLGKTEIGLGNVDNTSDVNKPVSTATQTALNLKQDTLVSGTNIKTINGNTLLGSGDIVVGGGGGKFVDGTDPLDAVYTTGNVGIGTVTPSEALEVSGRISQIDLGGSTFVGQYAGLNDDLTSNYNTAIGSNSLRNNTTGTNNVATGGEALRNNTTGGDNTAIGRKSLYSVTTGGSNVAIGSGSLSANQTGGGNVSIGKDANNQRSNNSQNIAIGSWALQGSNNLNFGVAIGSNALRGGTSGHYSVAIGDSAGRNSSGNRCVFLGYQAGFGSTVANSLFIANSNTSTPLIHGNFGTSELTINGELTIENGVDNKLGYKDSNGSLGTNGQVLQSNGTVTTWVENPTLLPTLTIGVDRTLVLTDRDTNIENDNDISITIPLNSSVAFPIGTQIFFTKKYESMDFAVAGGVTLNSVDNLVDMGRINCSASLLKINTDEWNLIGELV